MVLNTEEFAQNMLNTLPKFYLAEDIKQNNTLSEDFLCQHLLVEQMTL